MSRRFPVLGSFLLLLAVGTTARAAEIADLDQTMGIECSVHFLLNGSGQAIAADEDNGVQMVGFGAVFPALCGS